MAIKFTRYVDITSGVGAGAAVPRREFHCRVFTTNELVPTNTLIDFESADDVGTYFGTDSEEYARAVFYFGFISKNITRPKKLTFARWVDADKAPEIFGADFDATLAELKAITTGAFALTMGSVTNQITGLNFASANSFSDIAGIIETAINAKTGTQWTDATVDFDAVRGSFNLVGGDPVAAVVSVAAPSSGTNISEMIGWLPQAEGAGSGAIWSDGALEQSITDVLTLSTQASNNFGSFVFMPTLTQDQIVEAATWNDTQNVLFQYYPRVTASNASAISAAVFTLGGTGPTLAPLADEYPELLPAAVLAATNYDARNSVQNYMYQQASLTPSVTTDADADVYDALRVNYYGRTQTAGQFVDFYQRGVLMGLATDPKDMNTYANEQWLKDAAAAEIMTLLLSLAKISANTKGRIQLLTVIQSVIEEALRNGSISVGKALSTVQKVFISEITGDDNAWYQVQTIGYWVDCEIQSQTVNNATEFKAVYTLVYSKDDIIRKVEGTHVLI
jgi:hypothetical protein